MSRLDFLQRIQNRVSKTSYSFFHSRWMPGQSVANRTRAWALAQRRTFYTLSVDAQEQQILERVREQVAYCRRFVPYYRKLLADFPADFPRDLVEFRQIPILEKSTIRQFSELLISDEYSKEELIKHATGGSTGEPVTVYKSLSEHGLGDAAIQFQSHLIGGGAGRRLANLYGGDLDISSKPTVSRHIKDWLLNITNHGCFRLDEDYLLSVHNDFNRFQPDLLLGYASAIYLLASLLKKKGIQPNYPSSTILTAAEKLDDRQRDLIEKVFNVPVVERYGSREVGLIAYQKINDRKLWVDNWGCLVEPDGLPNRQNRAQLLISSLHAKAMPLLRYRIGDQAIFPADWSAEHSVRYLDEIIGRVLDFIYLPNGQMVHGSEFPHLFKDFDVILYQVLQESNGDVCVSIMPGKNFNRAQMVRCETIIRENLPGVNLAFEYSCELKRTPQNKLMPVISRYLRE